MKKEKEEERIVFVIKEVEGGFLAETMTQSVGELMNVVVALKGTIKKLEDVIETKIKSPTKKECKSCLSKDNCDWDLNEMKEKVEKIGKDKDATKQLMKDIKGLIDGA